MTISRVTGVIAQLAGGTPSAPTSDTAVNNFIQAYGAKIEELFSNAGLTPEESMPGQLTDWSTINFVNPLGTDSPTFNFGSQYFRFADAKQGAEPVFIRIDWLMYRYYRNTNTSYYYTIYPRIYVGLDLATIGDSKATSWIDANFLYHTSSMAFPGDYNTGVTYQLCARPEFFGLLLGNVGSTSRPYGFIAVDRPVYAIDGSPLAERDSALWVSSCAYWGGSSLDNRHWLLKRNTWSISAWLPGAARGMCTPPPSFSGGSISGDTWVFPLLIGASGVGPLTVKNILGYASVDFGTDVDVELPIPGGGTRTFVTGGSRTGQADHNGVITLYHALAH